MKDIPGFVRTDGNRPDMVVAKDNVALTEAPPNYPCFIICGKRYYLGMTQFAIPRCAGFNSKGDIMAMVWRYEDVPDHWYMGVRIRVYHSSAPDTAFDGKDIKFWAHYEQICDEEKALESLEKAVVTQAKIVAEHSDQLVICGVYEIRGGREKMLDMVTKNPPSWMHHSHAGPSQTG